MDAETPARSVDAAAPLKKRPPRLLLFLPPSLNRPAVVQWLKRVHAWTGFWGALFFLMIGISGFTLNHRATLKIDTGEPQEVMAATLSVDPAAIRSADDLGKWAQTQFGTSIEPKSPRGSGGPGGGEGRGRSERAGGQGGVRGEAQPRNGAQSDPGGRAEFMGKEITQAPTWRQSFTGPGAVLTVEYTQGANTVKATKSAQTVFGALKNLHKGVGLSMWWVLFIDTIAGALIAMSLTGALLWSRLHGPRLAALAIVAVSVGLALAAAWPSLL